MLWVFDLDGVVWLAGRPIPGAAEAVDRLRRSGAGVAFVTNNSGPTVPEYVQRLTGAGLQVDPGELATSSQAAASLVEPGCRVAYIGGAGLREALEQRGAEIVGMGSSPEAVVVGRSLELDFTELAGAARAIRSGARFVATNTDATFPTPDGPEPGAGALIAYLQVGSGCQAEVAGKPEKAMAELVRARYGQPDMVVGDRAETDGAFARRMGAPFALVLTGVTRRSDLPIDPAPAVVGDDLAAVVNDHLSGRSD
ncbi:MAG TPA: HAD-IIA family hydrolase [Acidimicrobiales bacterium]|nr:HAD-IIA family hydrolase [Acidimicrobiales bacterium]